MRLILSILMIIASITGFVIFIVPHYQNVNTLKAQASEYETVLTNARKLKEEIGKLVTKYNSFDTVRLGKLATMLPTNPQNVKLILELDALARQNGVLLQNVKVESSADTKQLSPRPGTGGNNDLGTLPITFSAVGPYNGFTNFLRSMEQSLRIIDVKKISFSSADDTRQTYQYSVSVNTYWLK